MKSINVIEYDYQGTVIRTSTQFEMEKAIMDENATRFELAHTSPLFNKAHFEKIEKHRLNKKAQNLLWNNVDLEIDNSILSNFMKLLYQPSPVLISDEISTQRWINH